MNLGEAKNKDIAMDNDRQVLQLTASNYQRWKFEVSAILGSKQVLDVTLGVDRMPTDRAKLSAWKTKDWTAMAIISRALDDEHHSFIRACSSAEEMWTTIVALKEQATQSTKLLAQQEFHSFTWEAAMSVSAFLSQLNLIAGKLESLDVKPDDSSFVGKVIHCLPAEYDAFRQSWRLSAKEECSFTELQAQLLSAEADMMARDPLASSTGNASIGKAGSSRMQSAGTRCRGCSLPKLKSVETCYECGEQGHMRKDCPELEAQKQEEESESDDGDEQQTGLHCALSASLLSCSQVDEACNQQRLEGDSEPKEESASELEDDAYVTPDVQLQAPTAPRKGRTPGSKNIPKLPSLLTMDLRERGSTHHAMMATEDPSSVAEATLQEDGCSWIKATNGEMKALVRSSVLDVDSLATSSEEVISTLLNEHHPRSKVTNGNRNWFVRFKLIRVRKKSKIKNCFR